MSKWKIECLVLIVMFPLNSIPAGEQLRWHLLQSKGTAMVDNPEEMDSLVCLMDRSNFRHWNPTWDEWPDIFFNSFSTQFFPSRQFAKCHLSIWLTFTGKFLF